MAGFIFSIYKEENIEGVKKCIRQGIYASKVPNDKLSVQENESSGNKSKQVMAAVLAFKGSGWALLVGFVMNLLLSNMDFQKKKLGALTTEELDQVEAKRNEEVQRLLAQKNQE